MEIARLLDAPAFDHKARKHLLLSSFHDAKQSQPPPELAKRKRRRRRRPSAQQIRAKNQRDADNSLILNLTLDVNDLRQQVHNCVVEKSIRETRMLVARERFNARSLQTVERFFHLFKDGYPEAFPATEQRFLSELLDENIAFGGGIRGPAQFFEQWHRYKTLFLVRRLRVCSVQIITSDASGCLIECLGEFEGRVTAAALETVFPHVLGDKSLVEQVLSRSFVCPTRTLISLDRGGRVVQYDAFSDVFEAMSALLDFNPLRVVKMMDNAHISEEGSMLPPVDSTGTCMVQRYSCPASPQGDHQVPAPSPSRNSIDFILSRTALITIELGENDEGRRVRLPWQELWRTGDGISYREFKEERPRCITTKNDLVRCTMNHVDREEDELATIKHDMRCKMTRCTSQRCQSSGECCHARYKTLKCQSVPFKIVYGQGEHTMATDAPPSPVQAKLTQAMKAYIAAKLEDTPSMMAQLAYSFLCREIRNRRIPGAVPELEKVQNFVKSWRQKNKPDSMAPVLEICRESMYDLIDADRGPEALVVFCDSKIENDVAQPVLGTGSVARPFRIGLTSMQLLERYVDIQRDPGLRAMLHLDSTHSIVKQKYPVFVLGISDLSGGFHPIVYCCTSQRTGVDISWILAFLKRVVLQEFRWGQTTKLLQ